jgi:ubiquinone biosynthesis accessory factor UbiJ
MRLQPFESLLNRNIAGSGVARGLCKRLDGKVLVVNIEGLPLTLQLRSKGDAVTLATDSALDAHATLSGTPLSLLRLAAAQPEAALRDGTVHIEGDAEVAQAFGDLLRHARPDLEEELSRVVGDVAAHQAGNVARTLLDFGRRVRTTMAQNISEYLQEEGRDAPTRVEADEFMADVDRLREDVDRLEAKLHRLEARHAP